MEETLPPGFRFHPTDEELIIYYLTNKVSNVSFTARAFADVDLNKCEPWDLPAKASMGKKEWYFFNLRDRKYPTGLRTNRATEAGYWKTTGKDKEIFHGGLLVGMKKTLVFYRGRAPKGQKTNWVMHEYRLETEHGLKPSKEEWVVCRVFQKSSTVKKPQPTSSSPQYSLESPNCDTNYTIANEFGDIHELLNFNGIATPSSGNNNNISLAQNYVNENMNMNLNLAAATNIVPLLPNLSSSLLSSNLSSVNSLLLRALQSRVYNQPREAATVSDYYSLITPSLQGISHFGNDFTNSNFAEGVASSSMVLNSVQQQQVQEEPCKLDIDIW